MTPLTICFEIFFYSTAFSKELWLEHYINRKTQYSTTHTTVWSYGQLLTLFRLNSRELSAVGEWLQTPKHFHFMRDHPAHMIEILGSGWGVSMGRSVILLFIFLKTLLIFYWRILSHTYISAEIHFLMKKDRFYKVVFLCYLICWFFYFSSKYY